MTPSNKPQAYTLVAPDAARSTDGAPALPWLLAALLVPCGIAYAMGTHNEAQVLYGVLGLLSMAVIFARPYWGLMIFTVLLYVRPEESIPALAGLHFTLLVAVITTVGMAVHLVLRREGAVRAPLIGMMLVFTMLATVSGTQHGTGSAALMDFARLCALVFLILNLIRTPDRYRAFVTVIILCTCYLSLYAVYLYFAGGGLVDNGQVEDGGSAILRSKATGIFSDPNDLAATIIAGMALTMTRFMVSKIWGRLFYGILAATMLWSVILTDSRGGLLALMLMIAAFIFVFTKRKGPAIVIGVALAGALLVAAPSRMKNFDSQEGSANSRFYFWDNGVSQLINNPITGVGYTKFPDVNDNFVAHNSFVNCFAELGLPAYIVWIGCITGAFRRRIRPPDEEEAAAEEEAAPALDHRELIGARLAFFAYLAAAFWITRTYTPIIYVLMSLPIAQPHILENFLREVLRR